MLAAGDEIPVNLLFFCKGKNYRMMIDGTATVVPGTQLQNDAISAPALFNANKNQGRQKEILFTIQIRNANYYHLQRDGGHFSEQLHLMITGWPFVCKFFDRFLRYFNSHASKHLHRSDA